MCEVEMTVLVDANGDYAIGRDADEARANYTDQIGNLEDTDGFRLVVVKLSVPCPAPVELKGTAPEIPCGDLILIS